MPVPLPRPPAAASRPWPASASGPGQGTITVNRRPFEEYFPSATHRMLATEPLRVTTTAESYDIDATIDGGGVSGQAGALRLGIARALIELDPELRDEPQAGRPPHPGRPREGEQEVRPEEGPQGAPVLEAVSRVAHPASEPTASGAWPTLISRPSWRSASAGPPHG